MSFSSRRIDNQLNIFEGIIRNQWFIGIQIIIIAGQTMIIFLGGQAFSVHRLSGLQWGYCLILGAISIPGGVIIRLIPDRVFTSCIHHLSPNIRQKHDAALDPEKPEPYEWNPSLEEIRNQLRFLKVVHGGRLKNIIQRSRRFSPWPGGEPGPGEKSGFSTFVDNKDPKAVRQKSSSHIQNSSPLNSVCAPAAAMAGVVAGSIAGWSPAGRGDSIPFSSDLLSQQVGIEVHPDTRADDPMNRDHYTLQVPPGQNPDLVHVFDISSAEPIHQRSVGRFLFKRRHSRREYVV
jgi:Ca2+-transporting ATPase